MSWGDYINQILSIYISQKIKEQKYVENWIRKQSICRYIFR